MRRMSGFLAMVLAAVPAAAAGGGKILHEPLSCVPAQGNGRVDASLAPGTTVSSVRVYFRAEGAKDEYYAEMRRNQPGKYWAVLPVAAMGQEAIVYRVVAREAEGEFARTPNVRVPVVAGCPVTLSEEEKRYAKNFVLGMTSSEQGEALAGFACAGIVAKITSSGDLTTMGSCVDGSAGGGVSVASSKGGASNPGAGGTGTTAGPAGPAGAMAVSGRPGTGAGGLVIGGAQGTGSGVSGQPVSPSRPPK